MNTEQEHGSLMVRPANRPADAKTISIRLANLQGAIARFIAGPPMTEQSRFKYELANARARNDWLGLR